MSPKEPSGMTTRLTPERENAIREWAATSAVKYTNPHLTEVLAELDAVRQDAELWHQQWNASLEVQAELESQVEALTKERDESEIAFQAAHKELDETQEILAKVESERNELANDVRLFVPGAWNCPKCHFALSRTSINAHTGNFGTTAADREESEPCPNDGTPMVRESWQERALELGKTLSERMDERFLFAERELDAAKLQVEALSRKVGMAVVALDELSIMQVAAKALKALREEPHE